MTNRFDPSAFTIYRGGVFVCGLEQDVLGLGIQGNKDSLPDHQRVAVAVVRDVEISLTIVYNVGRDDECPSSVSL